MSLLRLFRRKKEAPPQKESEGPAAPNPSEVSRMSSSTQALSQNLSRISVSSRDSGRSNSTTNANNSDRKRRKPLKPISYSAERVIGNGSFGIVYKATVCDTQQTVAIKKVLQDRRFKNRELQIMQKLNHPDVVSLQHCFFSKGEKPDDVYLNLVMEYVPETLHRSLRNYAKAKRLIPLANTKVYVYQVFRSIAYIHSMGICHRDIKPQNLLLDPRTHKVKLCDFGSAKMLVQGEPSVAYICSRYYRAPELVFEATIYDVSIDIWSAGCVFAELMLGRPIFPGGSAVDQLIEIIKVIGTPTKQELQAMNPHHSPFSVPQIAPHPWPKVFRNKAPPDAIDLISKILVYTPSDRLSSWEVLAHPFFDDLRGEGAQMPNGKPLPPLFNFTETELKLMSQAGLSHKIVPQHLWGEFGISPP